MYFHTTQPSQKRRFIPLALVLSLGFFSPSARAQFRASIQGTVTDPQGAAIPGATLTLTDADTGKALTATSDPSGVYNFNALPADHFNLQATAPGFKKHLISALTLTPEQANAVNVQLELGETTTTVNVSGDTVAALDTQTSNIGATVSSNDIQHLPSFNRDVFTLTQLAPGAIADGSQGAGGGVFATPGNQGAAVTNSGGAAPTENRPQANANGQQNSNNGISIDGISTVSAVWGGASVITPSEESIDNVRIVTNEYDAESGRFSGAQTMVTSKSGTNQLHGSAFIAIHRPGLNAKSRVPRLADGTAVGTTIKDTARFNQYGASLGGPLLKDRLFAFFAFESSPNSSTTQSTGWYETASTRSAAPSGSIASTFLNFPGSAPIGTIVTSGETCATVGLQEGVNCRTIAGQGLDIGSPLKNGLGRQDPTTTGTAANPGVGSGLDGVADVGFYVTSVPTSSYYRQFNGRMDADVTSKDHLAFAIYWVPQGGTFYNGGARAYNLFNHDQINEALSVIYNHTFSPTFLNEARANAAGWRWNEIASNPQQPVGLPQDNVTFAPNVATSSGVSTGLTQFGTSVGSIFNQWTFGYKDVATKVAGRHTIKFGGDYTQLHYLNNPIGRPTYGFYNLWSFLNDAPYQESGPFNSVTGLPGGVRTDQRENLFGGFVQDAWKAAPSLTINAGIRYSYFGALYAKQNSLPYISLGSGSSSFTNLASRTGGGIWSPQKANFGPQFGFNWSPGTFNNKLVLRGGFGLNFNQDEIAITSNSGFNPPTQNNASFQFASPTNPGVNGPKILYGVSSNPTSLTGFAPNPNTITSYNAAGLPTAGSANIVIIGDGRGNLPTTYVEHYSLESAYQFGNQIVASVGYQGSVSRHLINHAQPNAIATVAGYSLNPLVTGGDYWQNNGSANNNALLVELKHPFAHHFTADAQFQWAKSMDTDGSGPYSEDPYYPLNPAYSYGRSDFNVGKSFKLYGLWQPVFFHGGGQNWLEKTIGGWSVGGIFNIHTGFPFSPVYNLGDSIYCQQCGYFNLRPQYLGGAGSDYSNDSFINARNFNGILTGQNTVNGTVNGTVKPVAYSNKFFNQTNYQSAVQYSNPAGFPFANASLPPLPGSARNSFTGPGYKDVDLSLTKGFGLPNNKITGENARLEIRADAFNVFNILNLNPTSVANNVAASNFGFDATALGGRTITMQARFSF